jgi:hypothetical protein
VADGVGEETVRPLPCVVLVVLDVIRVHTGDKAHEFPNGNRFSTEESFNNLCVWEGDILRGVFSEGKWVLAEIVE